MNNLKSLSHLLLASIIIFSLSSCEKDDDSGSSSSSSSSSSSYGGSSSGGSSSGGSSSGGSSSGGSSSGGNSCSQGVSGCDPGQWSCGSSGFCYNTYQGCANSGDCSYSSSSSSGGSSSSSSSSSSGGVGDCTTGYTGPTSDIQLKTLCQTACAYAAAGESSLLSQTCANYESLASTGSNAPSCPYCP